MNRELFAIRLKKLRTEKGITRMHLARMMGYKSAGAISNMESGASLPSVEKLAGLASYFKVSIDWLVGRSVKK